MRRILFAASLFVLLVPAAQATVLADAEETPAAVYCVDKWVYGDTLGDAIVNCIDYLTGGEAVDTDAEVPAYIYCVDKWIYGNTLGEAIVNCVRYLTGL